MQPDDFNKSGRKRVCGLPILRSAAAQVLRQIAINAGAQSLKGTSVSVGIGAAAVFRNAARRSRGLIHQRVRKSRFLAQQQSHAGRRPQPQLSEKMLMQLGVFSVGDGTHCSSLHRFEGGGLPCRITLFTALIHIHRVACPSAAAPRTDALLHQWRASSHRHVTSPPPNAGPPQKLNFLPRSASFDAAL